MTSAIAILQSGTGTEYCTELVQNNILPSLIKNFHSSLKVFLNFFKNMHKQVPQFVENFSKVNSRNESIFTIIYFTFCKKI